ncbi:hypothetical protein HSX11_28155 [Oxalobacteraceae bacterium]|nr:hypothetical protein [Oxalobacteraceae bacterium]
MTPLPDEDMPGLRWRTLRAGEAASVHALHQAVLAGTPSGMVRPDPLSHFERHIADHGCILGCFADEDLVAYGVLGVRSPTAHHLAELLELSPADAARTCVLDGAATRPAWRGLSLHVTLIAERLALAHSMGLTMVTATVAPENMRSLRGLLRENFSIHGYALVYGGLPRLLVRHDTAAPLPRWETVLSVPPADHAGHLKALAQGLRGFDSRKDEENRWFIDYGRPL